MPYPATHLFFARQLIPGLPIDDPAAFYLGAIAPDSVIFRDGWTNRDKYISHLCVGNHSYVDLTDTEAWLEHVLALWAKWRHAPAPSFYLGWICHVWLDLHHANAYVLPFKRDRAALMEDGSFRGDMVRLDFALYPGAVEDTVMPTLRRCDAGGCAGDTFTAAQLEAIHQNVCYRQYSGGSVEAGGTYACIDPDEYMGFIGQTARAAAMALGEDGRA